jgi:hypothetical protein
VGQKLGLRFFLIDSQLRQNNRLRNASGLALADSIGVARLVLA